jgi:hypothetical protein
MMMMILLDKLFQQIMSNLITPPSPLSLAIEIQMPLSMILIEYLYSSSCCNNNTQ